MNENDTNTSTTTPTEPPKAPKPKKAKAKTAVKKSAAKAEKKAKKAKGKKGDASTKGPGALKAYAPNYHKDNDKKTAGGNTSVDNDDDVAKKLRGKDLDEVYAVVAKATEENEKDLRKRYAHLNVGMQRMNLGNKLRGVLHAK